MLSYLRKSPNKVSDIAIILAAVGGAAHILIRTSNYGPELDNDTWDYISVAENLTEGDGFKDYRGRNYTRGPLYPMLVALFGLVGINPIEAGRFVNIIGFGLIILLVGCWLSRQVNFRFLAVVGSVAIMTSYSLSRLSSVLMTDTLFTLFTLLALVQIQLFIKSKELPLSFLALSALFTGLAIATRYAGISILLTGVMLIFWKQHTRILHRLKCAVIYGSLSITPIGIWITGNWLLKGIGVGYDVNYGSSVLDYLKKFSKLFISYNLVLRPGLDWLIYLGCTAVFLILWRKVSTRQSQRSSLLDNPTPDNHQHGLPISVFSLFIVISISILLFMAPNLGTADQLGERQLLTTYVPVIIVVLLLLDLLLRRLILNWQPLYFALVCLISTGIIGSINLSSRWNIEITAQALEIGAEHRLFERHDFSYNMEIWTYLRDNPIDGKIYSNGNNLLYWFTDIPFGGIIKKDFGHGHCLSWIQELTRSSEPSYVIYFTSQQLNLSRHDPQFNACDIPALESDHTIQSYLERIGETPEAIVYQVLNGTD